MQAKYRYHIEGAANVVVRGLTIKPNEFFFSNVPLFTAADFSANPTLRMDTDLNLDGTWVSDTADDEAPAEVTSLAGVVDPTKATLSWVDPTIADFKEVVITHDQTGGNTPVIVAKGVQTRAFTGLTNAQAYVFTVQTRDEAGNLSAGTTITLTPAADIVAPAEVTRRNATRNPAIGSGEVTLDWLDPVTADFDHVSITHDQTGGATPVVVTKGVKQRKFTGLTANTTYLFTIRTVDRAGNLSTGVTVAATPL